MNKKGWRDTVGKAGITCADMDAALWGLGDCLLGMLSSGTAEGVVLDVIAKFKRDTHCSLTTRTLINLRKCSLEWPPDKRTYGSPWIVYWTMHLQKDLMRPNLTIEQAAEISLLKVATI